MCRLFDECCRTDGYLRRTLQRLIKAGETRDYYCQQQQQHQLRYSAAGSGIAGWSEYFWGLIDSLIARAAAASAASAAAKQHDLRESLLKELQKGSLRCPTCCQEVRLVADNFALIQMVDDAQQQQQEESSSEERQPEHPPGCCCCRSLQLIAIGVAAVSLMCLSLPSQSVAVGVPPQDISFVKAMEYAVLGGCVAAAVAAVSQSAAACLLLTVHISLMLQRLLGG